MRLRDLPAVLLLLGCWPQDYEAPEPAKVPVRSEVLEIGPFQADLVLLGRVEPAARLELRAPAAGRIAYPSRFAGGLRTGERVARGEVLFEIDNDDARLRLSEAELTARLAESELARARQGVEGGFLPAAELKQREIAAELASERLANARRRAARLRVQAPADGTLRVDRVFAPGSEVPRVETLVAELLGEGLPRVEAWAAASDRGRLRTGLEAECLTPDNGRAAGGGRSQVVGRGTVAEVAREIDRTGTLYLVVELTEASGGLLPGEGVELRILLDERPETVTVPEEALIVDGGVASVFVLEPSGSEYRARRRLVQSGSRSGGRVEILDGLRPGERVAVRGAEFLFDGLSATEAEAEKEELQRSEDEATSSPVEERATLPAVADEED